MYKKIAYLVGINGLISTFLGALLLWFLKESIAIEAWDHNLGYLFFYTLVVSTTLAIGRLSAAFSRQQFALLSVLVLISCAVSLVTTVSIGALLIVILSTYIPSLLLGQLTVNVGRSVLHSILMTAVIGSCWVLTTAPIYAEGFVILAWVILAIHNVVIVVGLHIIAKGLLNDRSNSRSTGFVIPFGIYVISIALSGAISFTAMYYMIRIEGEPQVQLVRDHSWQQAFQPITHNATLKQPQAMPSQVSKQRFIDQLLSQESQSISQIATLFFLTGERLWADTFISQIMLEAKQNKYTGNTGSIKFSQREVMIRALYLLEIQKKIPDLLTEQQAQILSSWFERVTTKILQPEWVDYLYAVPFNDDPDGPYLNQEIGAGAVAVLQHVINDATLKQRIQHFLEDKSSGFLRNYRNPDDSMEYQDVWIENAFVMHLYQHDNSQSLAGMRLATQWLISQLPQYPIPLEYGLPNNHRPLNALAIAAFFLKDNQARWLLEQHLQKITQQNEKMESSLMAFWLWDDEVQPHKAIFDSIVLDGPTGYAFRPGPLAPDKVIMRNTDTETFNESTYLIANLRNIGWHRYPATNTAIRVMFDGDSVAGEDIIRKKHTWLPAGRAKHRDKKIDRIRLNGLQIARDGLDGWIGNITGVYSQWRQDVPREAKVVATQANAELQSVTTLLEDWQGTEHYRTYLLLANKQLLVIDDVKSQKPELPKLISWHFRQDFEPTSAKTVENKLYSIAFSENIEFIGKSQPEEPAYDEFISDHLVSLDLTDNHHKMVVTAFSTKKELIADISINAPISNTNRYEINYSFNKQHRKLVMSDEYKWQTFQD